MTITKYTEMVIDLFKNGQSNDTLWQEMATAVLRASESSYSDEVNNIDKALFGECEVCGKCLINDRHECLTMEQLTR